MDNQVLWNHEMNICIGLYTEMDLEDFREEVKLSHLLLTSEELDLSEGKITLVDGFIFKFKY